jgi:hypothetical protein
MQNYIRALRTIFINKQKREKWLDENAHKLSGNAQTIESAKKEIYDIIGRGE